MTLLWLARVLFGATSLAALWLTWRCLKAGMAEWIIWMRPAPLLISTILTLGVAAFCEFVAVPRGAVTGATVIYGIGIAARLVSIVHDALRLRRA